VCFIFSNGTPDAHGYPTTIFGYDAPGTMGVLAKTMKLHQRQLIVIPKTSPFTLEQWAAFSLRYVTAWANWQVAWGCWQTQLGEVPPEDVFVCGWGGGVALAQLALAKAMGCRVAMLTSKSTRLSLLAALGIDAIDRSAFGEATFEADFLSAIRERTSGQGVSIFIDNIGSHYRSTLKALGRQGVITTSGWKHGITHPIMRSMECISRHIHVFTHYARYPEGLAAARFALDRAWMAPTCTRVYAWDEIPRLAEDYVADLVDDYFPIFAVNRPT
jgi:NADPH:quinone reductase-like Zn-dependent oxidoreductase